MLVIDATVALHACASPGGFAVFGRQELVAPPLMWSEARSALHEALWRRDISAELAAWILDGLASGRVRRRSHPRLGPTAWRIADELGWARTYDAEYVALAQLLGCRLVTLDARVHSGAGRLGFVVSPGELRPSSRGRPSTPRRSRSTPRRRRGT